MLGGYQELNMARYLKNALFTFENQNCIELYENQRFCKLHTNYVVMLNLTTPTRDLIAALYAGETWVLYRKKMGKATY